MSGYFVHGGTQYAYGQGSQQSSNQSGGLSGYQQAPPATQFYQQSSYGGQQSRSVLSTTPKNSSGFDFNSQPIGRSYSNQHSSYSSSLDSNPYNGRSSSSSDGYGRGGLASSSNSYASSYGMKQEEKYSMESSLSPGHSGSYYSSQNSLSSSYSNQSYPPKREEPSQSMYSYEKALYVAANQYFLNKKTEASRGSRTGTSGRGMRGGRGRGGRGGSYSASTGPKIIKATEVKAYLYAWCGQRRLKPEYTIEPMGNPPKTRFCCTLKIAGLDYTAKVTASSKKDSQSKAAWNFCEHLVETGYMKESDLPERPVDPMPKSVSAPKPSTPAGTDPGAAETVEESGGWSIENCRQRLNQFTQRWRIPAEFKHETHGPEHARSFIAELSIEVTWLDKEFHARERGNNKKQATAVCALAMIRQLFKEGLIEKHGDPIKNPFRRQQNKDQIKKPPVSNNTGTKRKADEAGSDDIDEYGNWKLEDGRQRLHMFCQATNQPFEMKYTPDGNTPPKTFTASISIEVTVDGEKKTLEASHASMGKKQAAQHCALKMIKELYSLSLVEANEGPQQSKKKNQRNHRGMGDMPGYGPPMEMVPLMRPLMFPGGPLFPPFGGLPPQRRAPYEDSVILEKHRRIYPSDFELDLIQKTVRTVETSLKKVADTIMNEENKEEEAKGESTKEKKRVLQGVVRVGALAKGLLLSGDLSAHLVLLCIDIPTVPLITKISSHLEKIFEDLTEKYLVTLSTEECFITVTSPSVDSPDENQPVKCEIKISVTSSLMRNLEPSNGPADMLNRNNCLRSLAELRHAKWFQTCASCVPSCVMLIRILLDLKKRVQPWMPLPDWALELIVEKALNTSLYPNLTVGEGFRRILSCISSGILLEDGPGIMDPCEKTFVDVIGGMTFQEREDVTESAHHALRMLAFRQVHKVLGVEPGGRGSNEGGAFNPGL